jgi:hypothetical protein
MGHNSQALIFAALIIGVAIYLGHTSISNVNEVTTVNTQTSTQTAPGGGGGGGDPLSTILGFL